MQRIIGMLILFGAIWVGTEVYTKGTDDAFGGLMAAESAPEGERKSLGSTPARAAGAFQRAYDSSEKRVDVALEKE